MFNVIVVSYYFPPMGLSGVQRTLKFVKYMPDYNWRPTVVTTGKTGYFAHDNTLLKELEGKEIEIVRTEGFDPNSLLKKFGTIKYPRESVRKLFNRLSQTFFIPDNKISWAKKALIKVEELVSTRKYDAIFITAPPFSAFSEITKIKKKYDIPIIFDYRDLWYGSYFSVYPTPYHKYKHKNLEYFSLKAADKILVTNRKIKEKLLQNYPFLSFDDVVIMRHGFDQEDFDRNSATPKEKKEKLVITHSGNFIEYSTPKFFLEAFKKLTIERPDIAANFELHFVGIIGRHNEKLIKRLKLEPFVKLHGYIDHNETIKKIKSSDVLWLQVGRKRNIDAILPGKLFEYVGARKPILGCVPEGAAKFALEEYKASYITEPENIDQIKTELIKIHTDFRKSMLPIPEEDFVIQHDRKYLTEQVTKILQFYLRTD